MEEELKVRLRPVNFFGGGGGGKLFKNNSHETKITSTFVYCLRSWTLCLPPSVVSSLATSFCTRF